MTKPFTSNRPYMLRAVYEWILDNDATPYLLVDATRDSVTVPQQYIQNGQIVLNIDPNAIQNWFTDNDAISFSARFSGKAMNIFIPMDALLAIYAQENGEGMVFPPENTNSTLASDTNSEIAEVKNEQDQEDGARVIHARNETKDVVKTNSKSMGSSHLKVIK